MDQGTKHLQTSRPPLPTDHCTGAGAGHRQPAAAGPRQAGSGPLCRARKLRGLSPADARLQVGVSEGFIRCSDRPAPGHLSRAKPSCSACAGALLAMHAPADLPALPPPPSPSLPRRASDPNQRPSFVEIVSRLNSILERETRARHPEADLACRSPSSPAETLKTFRLPPDGPAHKSAIAALQRRRSALIQGHSSDSGPGAAAAAGTGVGSAPPAAAVGSPPAAASGGGAAGSAPAAMLTGSGISGVPGGACTGKAGDSTADARGTGGAAGSSNAAGSTAGGDQDTAGSPSGEPVAPAAGGPPPVVAAAAAAAAAAVKNVDSGATDAPPSPLPSDASQFDITRS